MPSNVTWACMGCRTSVRRPATSSAVPVCSACSKPLILIGKKIPLPRRTNERAWRKLEASLTASRIASAHQEFVEKVQRRHELERRIRQLQERPKSPGRDRLIKELREELNR